MLRCQECEAKTEDALGWVAFRADDPDETDSEPAVAFYCPRCAEREFGSAADTSSPGS